MRIAYFSPLNPLKSGIADYSEELLPYLARHMEVDVYVDGYRPSSREITGRFKVFNLDQYHRIAKGRPYDANLYHIGNNEKCHGNIYRHALKNPGIVVLHDYVLHHMVAELTFAKKKYEEYLAEMEYGHGAEGRSTAQAFLDGSIPMPWETSSLVYPLNKRIVDAAKGLIVHSYFTRNKIKSMRPDVPVKRICHYAAGVERDPVEGYKAARQALGIADQEIMLASFGFANPAKRIDKILVAIARLYKEGYRFKYYVAGEAAPVLNIPGRVADLGIPQDRIVMTGYLDLEQFTLYMRACDIGFNLRYPVHGETSGSLHRLLGMGKPVLISNAGSFREYPDQIVVKIDVTRREEEDIYTNLKALLDSEARRRELGQAAYHFAQENLSIERSAQEYYKFIVNMAQHRFKYESLIEQLAGSLAELGISEDDNLLKAISGRLAELC